MCERKRNGVCERERERVCVCMAACSAKENRNPKPQNVLREEKRKMKFCTAVKVSEAAGVKQRAEADACVAIFWV